MSRLMLSGEVAARLGIMTQTLAKWRMKGKGPRGWVYLSATRCAYPEPEVDAFLAELPARRPTFNLPARRGSNIPDKGTGVNE